MLKMSNKKYTQCRIRIMMILNLIIRSQVFRDILIYAYINNTVRRRPWFRWTQLNQYYYYLFIHRTNHRLYTFLYNFTISYNLFKTNDNHDRNGQRVTGPIDLGMTCANHLCSLSIKIHRFHQMHYFLNLQHCVQIFVLMPILRMTVLLY